MTAINSINFLGAKAHVDSEAEYRLVEVGQSIIDAKRETTVLSTALKSSYAASIVGLAKKDASLKDAVRAASDVVIAWSKVAREFDIATDWLDGNLRSEFCTAFIDSVTDEDLFNKLLAKSVTADYMRWAFDDIAKTGKTSPDDTTAVLSCRNRLKQLADDVMNRAASLDRHLEKLASQPGFALYDHIFEHLALKAEIPTIFDLDEAYFASMTTFDIFYEAVEQTARHAHTLIPGTHDDKIDRFNLQYSQSASRAAAISGKKIEYQIDPDKISQRKLQEFFDSVAPIACGGSGGTIQMTDLLAIVNFPPDVEERIRNARGPVRISDCSSSAGACLCNAKNDGRRVEEDIPGAGSVIGIIIEEEFACKFKINQSVKTVDVIDITGLRIDLPGPINPTVDRIFVEVPTKKVVLHI